jgi:hypothetical protein
VIAHVGVVPLEELALALAGVASWLMLHLRRGRSQASCTPDAPGSAGAASAPTGSSRRGYSGRHAAVLTIRVSSIAKEPILMRIASRLRCRFRLNGGVCLPEVLAAPSDDQQKSDRLRWTFASHLQPSRSSTRDVH